MQLLYICNTTQRFNFRDLLKSHDTIYEVDKPDSLVKISSFCLMSNHYHILASPIQDDGISQFMLKLGTGYSMYFNTKYERSGTLFEGRYKAKHLDSDIYLKYIFSYIHLNPIRKKTYSSIHLEEAINYPHSSLQIYASPRAALGLEKIIDHSLFKQYFPSDKALKRELTDWINFEEDSALGLP